ncbi:Acetylxylan esterase / glucomannan deacetylase [Pseudoalteromonas holothuriae]|uniref:Acetylxylan esterase / glucomannan deacetylase n=1 Tax=Pseudoalteromonas holothuriae TaxID=2963714 RepID=A0ABM9GDU3_9GAMM|nr:SGNH/GDSL hydrolase family protein [Pseudoalteromonas sp. CIP111951]CAH9050160.1 Acetylxylan esterase / glucomannan deacetylase [Pseudoalteromonas sp. CIP111951]
MYKLVLFFCALISTASFASSVPATDHAIVYEGRVVKQYEQGQVSINWPGSSFKTKLTGKSLHVTLVGFGNQFDVLVDGKLHKKIITDYSAEPKMFELFSQSKEVSVEIEVVKRSEDTNNFSEIHRFDVDGSIEGIWQSRKHILFIGDSISAGFGSESNKRECTWQEVLQTSNARLAFPYVSSQMLGATYTQVSVSGLGLIRNWSGNQAHHDLTYYFDKAGALFQDSRTFEDRFPNLIVIEVGTNDFSTDPQVHEPWQDIQQVKTAWVKRMVEFVATVRARYPAQPIVFMPRPAYPYDLIIPATNKAIELLSAQGQNELYSHTFNSALSGCTWHPTEQEHQDIAVQLVNFIKTNKVF